MSRNDETRGVRIDPPEELERTREDPLGRGEPRATWSWFERLVAIMDLLRSPGGCPWDLDQEPRDLKVSVVEEAYEVLEAIDGGEADALCEELGDLLLQVVFLARMHKEREDFDVQDVARAVCEKLVRRHPHIFGETDAASTEQVVANWERIKDRERRAKGEDSLLSGLPASLPALLKAYRLGQKAQRVGFDWDSPRSALGKVREELGELERALEDEDESAVREELGDLLFSLAQTGRKAGIEPEATLQEANEKFQRRFRALERELAARGLDWDGVTKEELEQLWRGAR